MQQVFLFISRTVYADLSSISSILRRVNRLVSAVFSSIYYIFSAIFLEASCCTSATFSFYSASVSADFRRLAHLVSSSLPALAYNLSSISYIWRWASHLVYATVAFDFFLVSANSYSIQCIFCCPS